MRFLLHSPCLRAGALLVTVFHACSGATPPAPARAVEGLFLDLLAEVRLAAGEGPVDPEDPALQKQVVGHTGARFAVPGGFDWNRFEGRRLVASLIAFTLPVATEGLPWKVELLEGPDRLGEATVRLRLDPWAGLPAASLWFGLRESEPGAWQVVRAPLPALDEGPLHPERAADLWLQDLLEALPGLPAAELQRLAPGVPRERLESLRRPGARALGLDPGPFEDWILTWTRRLSTAEGGARRVLLEAERTATGWRLLALEERAP